MTVIEIECLSSGTEMFVQSKPIVHDQQVSVHHWQLRDLVLTDKQFRNELFVPVGNDIVKYDYTTGKKDLLLEDIGYKSTCIASGFGYLAAGGQHGDLILKDTKSDYERCITSSPGCTINNGLCFSRCSNGEKRLLVSNNDSSIRVFSVPDLNLIDTINFKTPVNNTCVSPDGEKMVAVGDDNSVHLFNISFSGKYELVRTMTVSKDANFSVAWNHASDKFAVSSQDGSVYVWDIRHTSPLARFKGVNPSATKGAIRCVKFTQSGGIDLLAFTEHASHVHIVDARTYNEQQTLKIVSTSYEAPTTGLCFSADSGRMFVGLDNAILDFQILTGARRRFPGGVLT
ncbi:WD40-repeat-containing domain protein [Sporodiniella umbellata]|nr:WD40-repeat-containing domain protein [Sporodiniella umbellata]